LAAHYDALEFPDGRTVLLTVLCQQQCFSCLRGQRARPRQMPRSASPKWAGRARRFKIEGLKYPIMKESDIMGALVEAEERTKVA
jgi:hypothetical protein